MSVTEAVIVGLTGLVCWGLGFITGARRKAQWAAKRANMVMREYDVNNPINQRQEYRYVGRSEYGTDWYEAVPMGGRR